MTPGADRATRRFRRAGYLLGFALGGFFDGILLHQVLQWHHLLSAVDGPAFRDLRVQVLADGVFHASMYVIALVGLWTLSRARRGGDRAGPGGLLLGTALVGFGAWHVIDGIVSHWLLGIHRIRMDSPDPLFWDLLWFFIFGVASIVAGLWLMRRGSSRPDHPRAGLAASLLLAVASVSAGYLATRPPPGSSTVLVLLRPGAQASGLLQGLGEVGGGILWANRSGTLWAFRLDDPERRRALYRHGALVVTASPAALGCLAWTRTGT